MKTLNLYNREYNKIKQSRFDIHELDVNTFCEKITGFKTKSEKEKMDALLELDTMLYTQLGVDSSLKDKKETKKKSRIIYRAIKSFNKEIGDSLLQHMDPDV
jgi:alcohol dehydrogenase YqhD (iron-dependent ADH family)